MPSPKKTTPATTAASIPPSKTSHLFSSRKVDGRSAATHEGVAADIEAFRKAGGRIEILGVTRTLQHIGAQPGDPPSPPPASPAASKTRNR